MSKVSVEDFNALVRRESLFGAYLGFALESVEPGHAVLRLPYRNEFARPGGATNGPVIMAIADYAMYAVVMSLVEDGWKALTTDLHTRFLRGAVASDLIAEGKVLKHGRRLFTAEVIVRADGEDEPVAHVTGTYALPPAPRDAV